MHGAIKRHSKATPVHARTRRSNGAAILDTPDTPAKMTLARLLNEISAVLDNFTLSLRQKKKPGKYPSRALQIEKVRLQVL